jgi:hypothetical protein
MLRLIVRKLFKLKNLTFTLVFPHQFNKISPKNPPDIQRKKEIIEKLINKSKRAEKERQTAKNSPKLARPVIF